MYVELGLVALLGYGAYAYLFGGVARKDLRRVQDANRDLAERQREDLSDYRYLSDCERGNVRLRPEQVKLAVKRVDGNGVSYYDLYLANRTIYSLYIGENSTLDTALQDALRARIAMTMGVPGEHVAF
jgi:hypothetical protein